MLFKPWKINYPVSDISISKKYPRFIQNTLVNRGFCSDEIIEKFLTVPFDLNNPFLIHGMEEAVTLIKDAIDENKKILIFGDYDCDGIIATVILYDYLENEGADIVYYIPDRDKDGYGLNENTINGIINAGIQVIITVDNGISSVNEIAMAREAGIQVIVTDHHALPDELPDADAVINPLLDEDNNEMAFLCGAGVAFKLAAALEYEFDGDDSQERLFEEYGDLLAIATVADVVPLLGENRTIVRYGLDLIRSSPRPCFEALSSVCSFDIESCNTDMISFMIAPRINACGRVGKVDTAVQFLLSEDGDYSQKMAMELNNCNEIRRTQEDKIYKDIQVLMSERNYSNKKVLVFHHSDWNPGVIGIVASKIMEETLKPVIILADKDGISKGSARSVEQYPIVDALNYCKSILIKFGGHKLAAGFSLHTENIGQFDEMLNDYAKSIQFNCSDGFIQVESEIFANEITLENLQQLEYLAPFGAENSKPNYLLRNVTIGQITPIGNGKHLKIYGTCENVSVSMVIFNFTLRSFPFRIGETADFICQLSTNSYNNRLYVSVHVISFMPSRWPQDKALEAYADYCSLMEGYSIHTTVEREQIAIVYKYLRAHNPYYSNIDGLYYELRREKQPITFLQTLLAIQILDELNLIRVTDSKGITIDNQSEKVELTQSKTYLRLNN